MDVQVSNEHFVLLEQYCRLYGTKDALRLNGGHRVVTPTLIHNIFRLHGIPIPQWFVAEYGETEGQVQSGTLQTADVSQNRNTTDSK